MKSLFIIITILIVQYSPNAWSANTPKAWYVLPEEEGKSLESDQIIDTRVLENAIDSIFMGNSQALEAGLVGRSTEPQVGLLRKPSDWVPWRAEVFTTDLSLSVGGLLGALMTKGTSTVRAYWRKQHPNQGTLQYETEEKSENDTLVRFSRENSNSDIKNQIESVIGLAIRAKKVVDSPTLRTELLKAAEDFQELTYSLSQVEGDLPWWVQRFRVDFSVDGSGHVHPNVTVGGEVRFRFEWHRIKKKSESTKVATHLSSRRNFNQDALVKFVRDTAEDLEYAFSDMQKFAFQAHTVRMGVGISAKGEIGVVKGSAGVVGQIYFTRDVKRPKKNPKPSLSLIAENSDLSLIEYNPPQNHIEFAKSHGSKLEINLIKSNHFISSDPITEVVYKVNRNNFRNGLKRAAKISEFFAKRASTQKREGWKIFELRTAFDASVSGELPLATIVGSVTAQIAFFNQKF